MIANLVVNALNYTPAPGEVTVRCRSAEGCSLIEVEDNGPGIAEEDRERVFQPFYRVLGSEVDGSGLGLPIVMEIARQHSAEVLIEDARPGHQPPGALFSVRFPARGAD